MKQGQHSRNICSIENKPVPAFFSLLDICFYAFNFTPHRLKYAKSNGLGPFQNIEQTNPIYTLKVYLSYKVKSQTSKLGLIIKTSAGSDLWRGSISPPLEEMIWMATSCVLCVFVKILSV